MEAQTIEPEVNSPLSDFQQAAFDSAKQDLENLVKELSEKRYLIDFTKDEVAMLDSFIKNDAPWKFTEALGIIEVEKEMKTAMKQGKLFTTSLAIEAIYFYLSKVDGKGKNTSASTFKKVEDYIKILKGITAGMEKVKADNERVKNAEFILAARKEGIEPDSSIQTA
jgi:hypothetical protein